MRSRGLLIVLLIRSPRMVRLTLAGEALLDRTRPVLLEAVRADLGGLPPLLVQAAAGDERLTDAQTLTKRATQHGVEARLEIYPADAHVFHIFWSFLPLAHNALRVAGEFARKHRGSASDAGA